MREKIFMTLVCISLLSGLVYATSVYEKTCPYDDDFKHALRKALIDYLKDPSTSELTLDELKEMLSFYLSKASIMDADCSQKNMNPLADKAENQIPDSILDIFKSRKIDKKCIGCSDGTVCKEKNAKDQTCRCRDINNDGEYEFCHLNPLRPKSAQSTCDSCPDGTVCGEMNQQGQTCECKDINNDGGYEHCYLRPLIPICTDSDDGKNSYVKGTCKDKTGTHTDECLTHIPENPEAVLEWYCSNPTSYDAEGACIYEEINCPSEYICSEGACVKKITCTDSDGGRDYYKKGTVTLQQTLPTGKIELLEQQTDDCVYSESNQPSCTKVIEYYCEGNEIKSTTIPCLNGCQDGACVKGKEPYCSAIGSKSEGWYQNGELIRYDNCDGCYAVCKTVNSTSEGWYSSCDGKLIKWEKCGETVCGNGICEPGETPENCPEDCKACVKEGESIPLIPDPPECCKGLKLIKPKSPNIIGTSGICTAKCGNGICDVETETNYNCPEDCGEPSEPKFRLNCNSTYTTNWHFGKCRECEEGYGLAKCETIWNILSRETCERIYETECLENPECRKGDEEIGRERCDNETVCGNGICETGEDGFTCPEDCCVDGDGVCREGCVFENDDDCEPIEVKVETICTDGIDNDGDGLVDNEDGDCWIKEGIIEFSNWLSHPVATWKDYTSWVPGVADIGIKVIYVQSPFKHLTVGEDGEDDPWNIKDYYAFNSQKGTFEDFREFIDTSHQHDLRVVFQLVVSGVKPGTYIYDNHQEWILHDKYGELAVVWIGGSAQPGWGYACDRTNNDLINFVSNVTRYWIREHDIDGFYLDSLQALHCIEEMEKISGCNCEQPVLGEHSSMEYARRVREAILTEKPSAIVIGEESFKGDIYRPEEYWEEYECQMGSIPILLEDICDFYPNDLDRYLMCSLGTIGPSFDRAIMKHIIVPSFMGTPTSMDSEDLINWFNQNMDCIIYSGNRARHISTLTSPRIELIKSDLYEPTIALMTTVPGIVWLHSHEFTYTGKDGSLYKKYVSIRNNNNALKYGSIENVWKSGDNTYAYLREYEGEKVVVVLNFLNKEATSYLDLSFFPKGTVLCDELNDEEFIVDAPSNFKISVSKYGSSILTIEQPICENLCGDGICQEVVCMGIGCPCAETPENCPQDCVSE